MQVRGAAEAACSGSRDQSATRQHAVASKPVATCYIAGCCLADTSALAQPTAVEAQSVWSRKPPVAIVPGPLQTGDYAKAMMRDCQSMSALPHSDVERQVWAWVVRQQLLTRHRPLSLFVVSMGPCCTYSSVTTTNSTITYRGMPHIRNPGRLC